MICCFHVCAIFRLENTQKCHGNSKQIWPKLRERPYFVPWISKLRQRISRSFSL